MKIVTGFFMAWGNFCAIPCPYKRWDEAARKHMLIMYPILGLVIGILWYLFYVVLSILHIATPLIAALMTAYPFIVSGFIHLDGYMDCNDAILSRRELEERQRILKDSHVGAFAVITAILLFMVFFAAMWSAIDNEVSLWGLIVAPVLARAMSARAIMSHRPLSTSQYDKSYNKEENGKYKWILSGIWLAAALLFIVGGSCAIEFCNLGEFKPFLYSALIMVVAELAASLISGAYGRKQLGGMNGDIAGFMLVWSELAAVISLAVI